MEQKLANTTGEGVFSRISPVDDIAFGFQANYKRRCCTTHPHEAALIQEHLITFTTILVSTLELFH